MANNACINFNYPFTLVGEHVSLTNKGVPANKSDHATSVLSEADIYPNRNAAAGLDGTTIGV